MKTHGLMAVVAAMAVTAMGPSIALRGVGNERAPDRFIRNRIGKGRNNRRGKGKHNSPKSRPNRLIISKRVRRKHRRAA